MNDEFEQLLAEMDAHLAVVKAARITKGMDGRERPAERRRQPVWDVGQTGDGSELRQAQHNYLSYDPNEGPLGYIRPALQGMWNGARSMIGAEPDDFSRGSGGEAASEIFAHLNPVTGLPIAAYNAGRDGGAAYRDPTPGNIVRASTSTAMVPLTVAGMGVGSRAVEMAGAEATSRFVGNPLAKTGAGILVGGTVAGTGMAVSMDVAEAAEREKKLKQKIRQKAQSSWKPDPGKASGTLTVNPAQDYKALEDMAGTDATARTLLDQIKRADIKASADVPGVPEESGREVRAAGQREADAAREKLVARVAEMQADKLPFAKTETGKSWPTIQLAIPAAVGAALHLGGAARSQWKNAPWRGAVTRAERGIGRASSGNPSRVASDIGVAAQYLDDLTAAEKKSKPILNFLSKSAVPVAGLGAGVEARDFPNQYNEFYLGMEPPHPEERTKEALINGGLGALTAWTAGHVTGAGANYVGMGRLPTERTKALLRETGGAEATAPERLMHVRQRMIDADRAAADVQTSAMQSERQRLINQAAYARDVRVERMRPAATPTRDYRQPRPTETPDNGPPMATPPPPVQQWPERPASFSRSLAPTQGPARGGSGGQGGGGGQPPQPPGPGYGQGGGQGGGGGGQWPPTPGQQQGQAYGAKQQSTAYAALHDMLSSVPVAARQGYRLDPDEVARTVSDALRHKGLKTLPDLQSRVAETIRRAEQLEATGGSIFSEAGVRHLTNFSYGPSGGGRKTSLALPVAGGLGAYLMGQSGEANAEPGGNALRYDTGEADKHHSYRQPRGGDGRFAGGPR